MGDLWNEKNRLGVWQMEEMIDLFKKIDGVMAPIEYGWVDTRGRRHKRLNGFGKRYRLQMPDELLESELGVCWDQVELERKLFSEEGIEVHTYFIVHYDDDKCPTHTFLLFEHGDKVYWYEHAWELVRGWHEYTDTNQALNYIRARFIDGTLHDEYQPENLVIYEYDAPDKPLSCPEFYRHCEKGKKIEI